MRSENFQLDRLEKSGKDGEKVPMHFEASRCSAVRTKPETRSSLLAATNAVKTNPLHVRFLVSDVTNFSFSVVQNLVVLLVLPVVHAVGQPTHSCSKQEKDTSACFQRESL